MLAAVDTGLFVTSMAGLHSGVNPVSGDFSVGVTSLSWVVTLYTILFAALLVPVASVFALLKLTGATDGPWWWILPYDAGTVVLIFFGAVGVVLYRRRRNRV